MSATEPYFRAWPCICAIGKHVWCPKHSTFEEYKRPRPSEPPADTPEGALAL